VNIPIPITMDIPINVKLFGISPQIKYPSMIAQIIIVYLNGDTKLT
jgi:hypothetical protein